MTTTVGQYTLGKTIGIGSYGKVKLGTHIETGEKAAIKIFSKSEMYKKSNLAVKIQREISVLKFLNHPNVLKLHDVFETSQKLYLVLQHIQGGDLSNFMKKKKSISREQILVFFQQIIYGLEYCHNHLICHRDLKPDNLLIDENENVKIGDFGMAKLMKNDCLLDTACGSPQYAAPEVINGVPYDGRISDIWSCGVVLYQMLSGKLPFDDSNITRLLTKVKKGKFKIPKNFTEIEADLISQMITVDTSLRINIPEIKKHPYFRSNFSTGYLPPSTAPPEKFCEPIYLKFVNEEIIQCLDALGWKNDNDSLYKSLASEELNLEKIFYRLFQKRFDKKNKKSEKQRRMTHPSFATNLSSPLKSKRRGFSLNSKSPKFDKKQRDEEKLKLKEKRKKEKEEIKKKKQEEKLKKKLEKKQKKQKQKKVEQKISKNSQQNSTEEKNNLENQKKKTKNPNSLTITITNEFKTIYLEENISDEINKEMETNEIKPFLRTEGKMIKKPNEKSNEKQTAKSPKRSWFGNLLKNKMKEKRAPILKSLSHPQLEKPEDPGFKILQTTKNIIEIGYQFQIAFSVLNLYWKYTNLFRIVASNRLVKFSIKIQQAPIINKKSQLNTVNIKCKRGDSQMFENIFTQILKIVNL
ncbi:protein kinase [Anaeramoeba ignava]|uniref:Protein kinase n=1 Tax=Anaeramoeba ignava TaxID=1746090 RepID=A0A9Q0L5D4_ANAIG|nr:protein kinase [Anaeramoeba ignava]